jgi:hypothetical protein
LLRLAKGVDWDGSYGNSLFLGIFLDVHVDN